MIKHLLAKGLSARKGSRCHGCDFCKPIRCNDDFEFYGCTFGEYHGKCVSEIEKCPKVQVTASHEESDYQGKWAWSVNDEEMFYFTADSREHAIQDGLNEALCNDDEDGTLYIGKIRYFKAIVDIVSIIEQIRDDAADECGESSEGYLDSYYGDIDESVFDELGKELQKTYEAWESRHPECKPTFYTVYAVEQFDIADLLTKATEEGR